jgi:hypothetical protein
MIIIRDIYKCQINPNNSNLFMGVNQHEIVIFYLFMQFTILRFLLPVSERKIHKCALISTICTKGTQIFTIYLIHLCCCNHFGLKLLVFPFTQIFWNSCDSSGCLCCCKRAYMYFSLAFYSLIASLVSDRDIVPLMTWPISFLTLRSVGIWCFCLGKGSFGIVTLSAVLLMSAGTGSTCYLSPLVSSTWCWLSLSFDATSLSKILSI